MVLFYGDTSETRASISCVIDSTSPTFAGIVSAPARNDGSFLLNWALATSTKPPVRYQVYVASGSITAAALFVDSNLSLETDDAAIQIRIAWLKDQNTYFVNGQIYTVGVRAIDSQGYADSNLVILTPTAIASGNIGGLFQTQIVSLTASATSLAASATSIATSATSLTASASSIATSATSLSASATSLATSATSLAASATSIAASEALLATDVALFGTYLATFNTYLATFASDLTTLGTISAQLSTDVAQFTADLVSLNTYLTTFNTYLATMSTQNTQFSASNVQFQAELATLSALIALLSGSVTSQIGTGGLQMEVQQPVLTMTITCE